jgi:multisubunit Na+/H+ antiporter MnhB subunit
MKQSVVFEQTMRILVPLLILISLFLFLRGHSAPGGGFVAGLVLAAALFLRHLAKKPQSQASSRLDHLPVAFSGLLLAWISTLIGPVSGAEFMQGVWWKQVGSPMVFDLGVMILVCGVVMKTLMCLLESE